MNTPNRSRSWSVYSVKRSELSKSGSSRSDSTDSREGQLAITSGGAGRPASSDISRFSVCTSGPESSHAVTDQEPYQTRKPVAHDSRSADSNSARTGSLTKTGRPRLYCVKHSEEKCWPARSSVKSLA